MCDVCGDEIHLPFGHHFRGKAIASLQPCHCDWVRTHRCMVSWAMPYTVITNPIYYIFFLFFFDMVIDWWVQFCQTNFYSSKWKSFLAFIHEQWNICIRRNWTMARNICINKHKVTSLNSQTSEKKHMRRRRRQNRMMKNVPLFAQNLNLFQKNKKMREKRLVIIPRIPITIADDAKAMVLHSSNWLFY